MLAQTPGDSGLQQGPVSPGEVRLGHGITYKRAAHASGQENLEGERRRPAHSTK